jgi:biopolymer transport protein ExbD
MGWKWGAAGLLIVAAVTALLLAPIPTVKMTIELPHSSSPPRSCDPVELAMNLVDGRTTLKLEGAPVEATSVVPEIARLTNGCAPASSQIDITADSRIKFGEFSELTGRLKKAGYTKLYLTRSDKH